MDDYSWSCGETQSVFKRWLCLRSCTRASEYHLLGFWGAAWSCITGGFPILNLVRFWFQQATSRAIPLVDEDTRLNPILDNLAQGFIAGIPSDWVASAEATGEGITADMVDSLAKQHFPLCMRVLHQSLRKDHHLKHFGRLHYGLFLKVRYLCDCTWYITIKKEYRSWVYRSTKR